MKTAQFILSGLCALCFTSLAFSCVLVKHEIVSMLVVELSAMGAFVCAVFLLFVCLVLSDSKYR